MKRRQVAVTVALVVCSAVLVAVPVAGLAGTTPTQLDNASATNTTNSSFGTQIASFMQASAVDINTSVESGMWQASVNQTIDASGDPTSKVDARATRLERRLRQLQNRTERLQAQRDALPEVAYTARASALREQIANLREDVNSTTTTAMRVGVNASRLDRLRSAAGNATGPAVAEAARSITDAPRGPPTGVPGAGPPADAGENGGPPADAGPPSDRGPPSDNRSTSAGNGTSGPPTDAGPPSDRGDDTAPGEPGSNLPSDDDTNQPRSPSGQPDSPDDTDGQNPEDEASTATPVQGGSDQSNSDGGAPATGGDRATDENDGQPPDDAGRDQSGTAGNGGPPDDRGGGSSRP